MANDTKKQLAREIARVIQNDPATAVQIRQFIEDPVLLVNLGFADKPLEVTRWQHFKALFTFKK